MWCRAFCVFALLPPLQTAFQAGVSGPSTLPSSSVFFTSRLRQSWQYGRESPPGIRLGCEQSAARPGPAACLLAKRNQSWWFQAPLTCKGIVDLSRHDSGIRREPWPALA